MMLKSFPSKNEELTFGVLTIGNGDLALKNGDLT
jgi:hypothetical protein